MRTDEQSVDWALRRSDWLLVDQAMIDRFADATLDRQYIHVDPDRAARSPFGGTVAHGFLTLSLLTHLFASVPGWVLPSDGGMAINYGFDRVRFVHPVRSGQRIRAVVALASSNDIRLGEIQRTYEVAVEIEGETQPAIVGAWIIRFVDERRPRQQDRS